MLKIIVKNKETGEQKCINIPKERENDSDIRALKVGMTVGLMENIGRYSKLVEIVKIVDDRPNVPPPYWTPYPWQKGLGYLQSHCLNYHKAAGRTTSMKEYVDNAIEIREEKKKYREKPYFGVRLDIIKGKPDGKENLEKMKFPCWCVFKYQKGDWKHHIGMLVTGFPNSILEYQLIDMGHQEPKGSVCTVQREIDLKVLMDKYSIEVIKGETQCWKVGRFNV